MPAIYAEVDSQIGLGPTLFSSEVLDTLAKLNQQGIVSAGHAPMVALLSVACVWHARQTLTGCSSRKHEMQTNFHFSRNA